ncbi:MAG: hypothetical protein EXS67_05565 [Candidatus Margulisbacteria bacterium]|nr:hypothetical protein [Candidatus Margulisiibacteriota bacterium]
MLNGIEKAQLLLSLLQDRAKDVLKHLSPESARMLTGTIDDGHDYDKETRHDIIAEALQKAEKAQHQSGMRASLSRLPQPPKPDMPDTSYTPLSASDDPFAMNDAEEAPPVTTDPVIPDKFENIAAIAKVLSEQKIQIIAFVLHHLDEKTRAKIIDYLPLTQYEKIQEIDIEKMPLSPRVVDSLIDSLIKQANARKDVLLPNVTPKPKEDDGMDSLGSMDDLDPFSESAFSSESSASSESAFATQEILSEPTKSLFEEENIFKL